MDRRGGKVKVRKSILERVLKRFDIVFEERMVIYGIVIEIKKDLFKLNKKFLEDFKNYQIIKLNILRNEDEFYEATQLINKENRKRVVLNPVQKNGKGYPLSQFQNNNKKYEDLTSIEKVIIEEEKEQIKSNFYFLINLIEMKIRRLERTLTKELKSVVRKSNKMFR